MRVEKLKLRNFRNIEECEFLPGANLNFLLGKNGQGKTSVLEALGYLSTLRSFRGSKTPEVIRWGSEKSEISCKLSTNLSDEWKTELKVDFSFADLAHQRASKVAFVNGKPFRSSTQYLSQRFGNYELGFHSVIFNPADHDLVRTDPATRRAYLDRVISAEDVEYLRILQKYQRVLDQRNALLKSADRPSPSLLAGFTEPMGKYAAYIALKRLEWILRLSKTLNETVHQIARDQPVLKLFYLSNWVPEIANLSLSNNMLGPLHFAGHGTLPSLEPLEQAFWKKQASLEAAEWKSGHSLVGPHRDDWSFFLGGQVLKGHGSQGEVRSSLLALKLAEVELFQEATGHRPVFLLDDFSSELDRERRAFLLEFLSEKDLQVFVTTTDDSLRVGSRRAEPATLVKRFGVVNGALQERD